MKLESMLLNRLPEIYNIGLSYMDIFGRILYTLDIFPIYSQYDVYHLQIQNNKYNMVDLESYLERV